MIATAHDHRTVADVRPVSLFKMRDAHADTPGEAYVWLSAFGSLMYRAIKRGLRDDTPCDKIPILALGGREPWPTDLLAVCLAQATPMTRLAFVTGRCPGKRVSDCVQMQYGWMQYGWITAGTLEFTQVKKLGRNDEGRCRADASILAGGACPAAAALGDAALPALGCAVQDDRDHPGRLRKLMSEPAVQEVVADLIARAMIVEHASLSLHGLRKNACWYRVGCGINDSEIGEILGMSPEMARRYKRARALLVARGALDRMTGGKIITLSGTTTPVTLTKNG